MTALLAQSLTSSEVVGSVEPRIWTPPLRELTPDTSYGFDVIEFADVVLDRPLDPWQEWAVIHGGELLPDGRPRFRILCILVARQNGKTELLVILTEYWLFAERLPLVLGTSTNLDYARESWEKAVNLAEGNEVLADDIAPKAGIRRANGEQTLTTVDRCRYKIAAANRRGGRSLTIHRLVLDELREHHDWSAYNAATYAMNAVPHGQAWAITNQGDEKSVVLESLRNAALRFIETGQGDPRLGLFEYSAPDGSSPTDPAALALANPNLGRRLDLDSLLGAGARAAEAGGEELAGYKTEVMCMKVPMMNPAVDTDAFGRCLDPGGLEDVRDRVALVVDVSMDALHATLYAAAALDDERVRVDPVAAWEGPQCTKDLRRELPGHVKQVRPQVLGWFPNGPAAAIGADLAERKAAGWPPPGVKIEEIRGDMNQVCMGWSELVGSEQIAQSGDPLLTTQSEAAEKWFVGDGWRFIRKGAGHVDAVYAAAGATHLARLLQPKRRPRLVVAKRPVG